jgi:hypothetical protein
MPPNTIYVGRPSKFGNPFRVEDFDSVNDCVQAYRDWLLPSNNWIALNALRIHFYLKDLRGKDLACWCPLDQPCHADILLELANQPATASDAELR